MELAILKPTLAGIYMFEVMQQETKWEMRWEDEDTQGSVTWTNVEKHG